MNARETIQGMMTAFQTCDSHNPKEVWRRGKETAQAWLRLMDADVLEAADVTALAGVMHANWNRSSGWSHMASAFYDWAAEQGVVLLPRAVFFSPHFIRGFGDTPRTPEQLAIILIASFEQKSRDDPRGEVWGVGASLARVWLTHLQSATLSKDDITAFTQQVVRGVRPFVAESLSTRLALGVIRWCRTEVNEETAHAALDLLKAE